MNAGFAATCIIFAVAALPAALEAGARELTDAAGLSGAWFDPDQDGQGWVIEVLPGDVAVVYWFTYPPEGAPGTNAWIQGVGQVVGNEIRVTETVITRGARFGQAFDPEELETGHWGQWTMTFADCESGHMTYEGPEDFGSGEFTLARLSGIRGSACDDAAPEPARTGFSGSWFDPATEGQGLTFGVLPGDVALAYWFTYDPEGNQAWLLALGESRGARVEFPDVYAFHGAAFGENFDPGAVQALDWGSLSFTFDTCDRGTLNYRGPDGAWGAGSMPLTRLSSMEAHACELPEPAPVHRGRWAASIPMSPGTSEVGTTTLDGFAYVAGDLGGSPNAFLRLDPEAGRFDRLANLPSPRDHAVLAGVGGGVFLMGGRNPDNSVHRYDPALGTWEPAGQFPFPFGHASGAVLGDFAYLVHQAGRVQRFDPVERRWRSLGSRDGIVRDHAATVAYRGEIWWLAGRDGSLQNHRSVEIFDPVTRVWRPGPTMNDARSGFAAAVVDGQILVAGGEDISAGSPSLVNSLEVYAPGRGWSRGPAMPAPVHGAGGAELLGRFHVLGGSVVAGAAGSPGFSQVYVPGD